MNFLEELDRFAEEEVEGLDDVIETARSIMKKRGIDYFDDELGMELGKMYGWEYIGDNLQKIISALGVEDKQQY